MCSLIDIAIPWDERVRHQDMDKLDKYQDLTIEL